MLAIENPVIAVPGEDQQGEDITTKRLGKAPAKGSPKLLQFNNFLKPEAQIVLPAATNFWPKRAKFPLRTWGNTQYGDCTRAKQALAHTRMERLEQRRTIDITDDEVIRVYVDMSNRLYGGGDNGAYEIDALNEWRNPDLTFRDNKSRPLTIDAFTAINHRNIEEVKKAMYLAAAHGIAVCFNLPAAWQRTYVWDIPEGQQLINEYVPGSWGGHSMWSVDYDEFGPILGHTWGVPDGHISWRAFSIYCDEAYLVVDSVNAWKKRVSKVMNIDKLKSAVNNVSDLKIK